MFGNGNGQNGKNATVTTAKPKRPVTGKDAAVTILTSGCHFNGKLYCRGSSRIGGKIEGHIVSEGLLIVEEDAHIVADVKADEAIIQGRVSGRLEAKVRVELCPSARFDGDIVAPSLIVHEGAQFNGRSTMTSAAATETRPQNVSILPTGSERAGLESGPDVRLRADDRSDASMRKGPDVVVPHSSSSN